MTRFPLPLGWGPGLFVAALLLGIVGCSASSQEAQISSYEIPEGDEAIAQESPSLDIPAPPPPPFKVVVLLDFSGSSDQHRVQHPTPETLQPLSEALANSGGAIAVGAICNDSNQPFTRISIDEPPIFPEEQLHNPTFPTPVDETAVNPLRLPEKQREFEEALADYNHLAAEDKALLKQHQKAVEAYQAAGLAKIRTFKTEIAPILTRTTDCTRTDLWGGLKRADLLLSEDASRWSTQPDFYLLVVSDGLDTQGKSAVTLNSNPEILLVNGSGSVGIFADLEHKAFESVDAAIAYLASVRNRTDDSQQRSSGADSEPSPAPSPSDAG
ncbi:MAG: hypothetical protein AAFW75_02815 [Cyanobacteria bacterium J06636_16]